MKRKSFLNLVLILSATSILFFQCKKDDVVEQKASTLTYGTDVIDTYTKDSQDSIWDLESHSRLIADFQYYGESVRFDCEFILWDVEVKFDEANPANSKIEAVVHTRSIQTGAPAGTEIINSVVTGADSIAKTTTGRDGEIYATSEFFVKASDEAGIVGRSFKKDFYLNGCLTKPKSTDGATASTVGITTNGTKDAWGRFLPTGITNNSDKASFKSTSVERLGDGYLAKGTFTWNGITEEVFLKFKYLGEGPEHKFRSIEGELEFSAFDKGFIVDSHVAGSAKVKVYAMFSKKKA